MVQARLVVVVVVVWRWVLLGSSLWRARREARRGPRALLLLPLPPLLPPPAGLAQLCKTWSIWLLLMWRTRREAIAMRLKMLMVMNQPRMTITMQQHRELKAGKVLEMHSLGRTQTQTRRQL
jgi:hypothetical protein